MDKAIGRMFVGLGITLLVIGASIESIETWEIVGCSITTVIGVLMMCAK